MGWDSDNDSGSDNEFENTQKVAYLLIAIDCDDRMFEANKFEGTSTFKAVLKTCKSLMDRQLLKGGKRGGSRVGIVIISQNKEKMILCNFKDHLPSTMKTLRDLCEKSDEELKDMYRRDSPLNFGDFILQSKLMFKDATIPDSAKYLAYITLDEDPVLNDDDMKFQAVNQAKTLKDFEIQFQLLTFKEDFQYDSFFKEIIFTSRSSFNYEYLTDMISLEDKLLSWLTSKGKRVRFVMYPNSSKSFVVIEKTYIKPMSILSNVKVKRDTLEEVIQVKKTGIPSNSYSISVNSDTVTFNQSEREIFITDQHPVGLVLVGTSSGLLEPGMQSIDPKFIQESKKVESPYFDLFWKYCVDRNKTLICLQKYTKISAPKLVELSATIINNVKSFLVQGIPYVDDINEQDLHNPLNEQPSTDNDMLMEAAENLVTTFDFDYDPMKIHDSVNCKKWEYVRSELLEEPVRDVEEIINLKVVEGAKVDKVVNEFRKLVVMSTKRPATNWKKAKK